METTKKRLVIGVDFDGTLVEEAFPEIGALKQETVEFINQAKKQGHLIIIWTARSNQKADEAKEFLEKNNIYYDYFNENPEDPYALRGEQGRKIFCDIYLDDRCIHIDDIDKAFNVLNGHKKLPKFMQLKMEVAMYERDYSRYHEAYTFQKGEIVEILRVCGETAVIYSKNGNESTTVHIKHLQEITEVI